jgi:hypothetical protein
VPAEVREWQNGPLDPVYPVMFFDAPRVKIRDEGLVKNKAIYLALALLSRYASAEGERGGSHSVLIHRVDMTNCALNDALERGVRPRLRNGRLDIRACTRQRCRQVIAKFRKIDVAREQDGPGVGIVCERQRKMLRCPLALMVIPRDVERATDRLMQILRKRGHG